ncbi:MAG: hypothetical protein Q8L60_11455 [Gammaproteobacteria bacterium]|nr:hypothetical protein [Gammaproteobacteria bacterium]MDP2347088.1 hypothetical protein [Gammaproteobacteria bacterium]
MSKLLQELKRRKVFKVAAVYAVVSWLVIQVATAITPALQLPTWTPSLVVVLLLLGFIPSLIAAWAYELTADGLQPDAKVTPAVGLQATSAQPINYVILGVVLLVAGVQLAERFSGGQSSPSPADDTATLAARPVVARFDVTPISQLWTTPMGTDFSLSRDGSVIVYLGPAEQGGGWQLWQRTLADLTPVPVRGTAGAASPALSPDARSVAFVVPEGLRTVSLSGGAPVRVTAATGYNSTVSWPVDDQLYYSREGVIYRVSASGGTPEAITAPAIGDLHRHPELLPNGQGMLLTVFRGSNAQSSIAVVGLEGGEVREILAGTMARYAASGHIVYSTADSTLMAAPFDVHSLDISGPSVVVLEGLETKAGGGGAQFALSEAGALLYNSSAQTVDELVWVNRSGQVAPVDPAWTGAFENPALSPDGMRLAVVREEAGGHQNIWVKQLDRGSSLKLTLEENLNNYPAWTSSGESVTFYSNRSGSTPFDLWTQRADGSAQATLQFDDVRGLSGSLWSRDGEWLVTRTNAFSEGSGDIFALRPGQDTHLIPLLTSGFGEFSPTLSPDARWMAYTSNESGEDEIYVVPFPNTGEAKWVISTGGGSEPLWSKGGGEIFYRNGEGEMVAVSVKTEPIFAAESTSVLFPALDYHRNSRHRGYDVAPDGQRFLMIRPVSGAAQTRLVLVQNFFEELRGRR